MLENINAAICTKFPSELIMYITPLEDMNNAFGDLVLSMLLDVVSYSINPPTLPTTSLVMTKHGHISVL